MRCTHANHKSSSVPYHMGGKTFPVSIYLGFNRTLRRYEMCDEGMVFVPVIKSKKRKKAVAEEV
jgi:hypothetical protein